MKIIFRSGIAIALTAASILYSIFAITTNINERLTQLVVIPADPQSGNSIDGSPSASSLQKLYPLVANASTSNSVASINSEAIDINKAFLSHPEKDTTNIAPDYFIALKDNNILKVDAITDNGAIINGSFVQYDFPIEAFGYPGGNGKTTFPKLIKSTINNAVSIKETTERRRAFVLVK